MPDIRLLGPFPPPFGGVAIHLVRLAEFLQSKGIDVKCVSIPKGQASIGFSETRTVGFSTSRLLDFSTFLSKAPVHYHTDEGNFKWMLLLSSWWRTLGVPYVVTVHSFRHRKEFDSAFVRRRLNQAYSNARAIIAISNDVKSDLISRLNISAKNIHVIGSALPISNWERNAPMPDAVPQQWLDADVRILVNAGRVVRYEGKDLYGLDVVASAIRKLEQKNACCLFVIGEVIDESVIADLSNIIGDDNRICIVRGLQAVLTPVVAHSHIVIRATRTEGGESLSLMEALEFGKIAIGSDAVQRPEGTLLFENENAEDLAEEIQRLMENGKWKVENGKWKMENGKWNVERGTWNLEPGTWNMELGTKHQAHGYADSILEVLQSSFDSVAPSH